MANPAPPNRVATLVGREREQALLREALESALAGHGGLVLIGGEAGIGKTALAADLCRAAVARGALALVGRCYDLSETPPYGPWVELFERLAGEPDCPPLPAPLGGGEPAPDRPALFARAREALAAARRPVVALLDDLHWADPASLDLLRYLSRRAGVLPLLLLATYRADELSRDCPLYGLLPALVREAEAVRVAVPRLGLRGVATLVAARYPLPEPDAERLAAYLDRRAEGNPFFVGELLRALEEGGLLRPPDDGETWILGDLAAARLPSLVRQVIDGRAARLGAEARELLALAAAIGQEVDPRLLAMVAGVDEGALLPAAEAALAARLLEEAGDGARVRFPHALVREALYEATPPLRRRALHRQIAEALAATPSPDPDAVAHHFRQAGDARAYEWLVRAGERAEASWAWQAAAGRYEVALGLADAVRTDAATRGWLHYRLGALRMYADVGQGRAALTESLRVAEVSGDAALRAYALARLGWLRYVTGDIRRGLADLEAGTAAQEALPPEARRRHPCRLAPDRQGLALLLAWVGRYAEARAIAEAFLAQPARRNSDSYAALRDVHAAAGDVQMTRELVRHFDEILRRPDVNPFVAGYSPFHDLIMVALPYAADDLAWRRLAEESAAGFARAGELVSRHATQAARLPLLLVECRWAEAREAGEAMRAVREAGEAWWDRVTGPVLATIAHAQGEPAAAWALVRAYHPDGPATAPGGTYLHAGLALQRVAAALALDAGDPAAARDWLAAHDRWLAWSGAVLGRAEGALAWATFCRAADDLAAARQHAEAALAHAREPRQPLALLAAHRLLGELDTADGRHAQAAARHLATALALADTCAAPYERALTLLALAELRAATGEREAAATALAEARAICEPLEARPALARADALAARLDAQVAPAPAYPAGLTAREVDVLRLVAEGLTDAQVAARLFVSPRTVSAHLHSIYTKLDVSSRTAAARFATEHGLG